MLDQLFLTWCSFRLTCFTCFTCCKGKLCGCGFLFLWFVCLCFLVAFVWFSLCLFFPLLPACLSSFTDWCLVHRQQSREEKKLDELETYDMNFDDEEYFDDVETGDDAALQELTFPFSVHEPCLTEDEFLRLGTIADALELKRLREMQVLTGASSMPTDAKILSLRFVKQHSNSIMLSIDVKDAFLTVKPQRLTIVNCAMDLEKLCQAKGMGAYYGITIWRAYSSSSLVCPLMLHILVYSKLLTTLALFLIHVDDILVVGQRDYVLNKLVPCLKNKYEISTQMIEKPGDELHFLKRKMTLLPDSRLVSQAHHKHVQEMCHVLGLNKALQRKKSPGHAEMDQCDLTGETSPGEAKAFRTCVGVLLYLAAADLPHCQHVVRHLASYSTQPTLRSMLILKHLVGYLAHHEDVCISFKFKSRNDGIFHQYGLPPGESAMEVYTDSDWASDKGKRRSVSCVVIFRSGIMLYSASRTQKLVSLSFAEAELYACSSGVSDSILLSRLIAWMTGYKETKYLYTDSSGARGMIQRQGVGRVRQLSCRVLWLQDLLGAGQIKLSTIAGSLNPANISTKRLTCSRLKTLMHTLGMYNTRNLRREQQIPATSLTRSSVS